MKKKITYKDAGVDIAAGEESVRKIKEMVKTTFTPGVLQDLGHFGAMFEFPVHDYQNPVLISSVDGVGTKLKVAMLMNKHDTIGEDLVNHCVDDILTAGARPLYFLDYLALAKVDLDVVAQIVAGMVRGCRQANCALIGGETAEMPDLYQPGEYDLAGTIVGVAEKNRIIDGSQIEKGDVLLGLPSNGLHTNGYTLARKILFDLHGLKIDDKIDGLELPIGEELLRVHRNYFPLIFPVLERFPVHGLAHITGGGLLGNLQRIIPEGLAAKIDWQAWPRPQIFRIIQALGSVPEEDMRRTFNLGIGFVLIVPEERLDDIRQYLQEQGEESFLIGEIRPVTDLKKGN